VFVAICSLFFSLAASACVTSLNKAVTLFRAMVIGKSTGVYEELFEYFFRVAAANGLVGPRVGGAADDPRPSRAPFVSATMNFETAQHQGFFRALARVFGGQPQEYRGRVVGCGVHFKRFLLAPCGNDLRDPFYTRMVHLREAEMELAADDVRVELSKMAAAYEDEGQTRKANILQWLLRNDSALVAAFPRCSGVLDKFELLATSKDTNACESLNRQTKQVVSEKGASSLMEVVAALSDFDHRTMASLTTSGRQVAVGLSQTLRMSRAAALRKRRSNAVPAAGQPHKAPRRRRSTANVAGSTAAAASEVPAGTAAAAVSVATGAGVVPAGAPMVLSASLIEDFQAFLQSRVGAGVTESGASAGGAAGGASTGSS